MKPLLLGGAFLVLYLGADFLAKFLIKLALETHLGFSGQDLVLVKFIRAAVSLGAAYLYLVIFGFKKLINIGYINSRKIHQLFASFGIFVATYFAIWFAIFRAPYEITFNGGVVTCLVVTGIFAFWHEILFRWMFYSSFRARFSKKVAIIANLVVETAAMWMSFGYPAGALFVSLVMIMLFERTESLWWNIGVFWAIFFGASANARGGLVAALQLFALFLYLTFYYLKRYRERRLYERMYE